MKRPGSGCQFLVAAGLMLIAAAGAGLWGMHGDGLSKEDAAQAKGHRENSVFDADGHMEMRGAEMSKMVRSKPAYRVKANSIEVVNKKVGFLSIGGLRQIEIDGLRLDLYREGVDDLRAGRASDVQDESSRTVRRVDIFKSIFDSMRLGGNNLDSVAGLQANHVQLCFWDDSEQIFRLYAGQMRYDPADKAVVFTDHVRVSVRDQAFEVQNAHLDTAQLTLKTSAGQRFDLQRMEMAAKKTFQRERDCSWW